MQFPILKALGEFNPQLVREIKGRFRVRTILIAIAISLLSQFVLFIGSGETLPTKGSIPISHQYCSSQNQLYYQYSADYWNLDTQVNAAKDPKIRKSLEQERKKIEGLMNGDCPKHLIEYDRWISEYWKSRFMWISVLGCFALIVGGTYMLISDLATEERRGTLNFIRLSPQSPNPIFIGKLLGVPSLLYLAILCAIPLHLVAGITANISLGEIFTFYGVVTASCMFFYSLALLIGLTTSSWLNGLQSWLGTSLIFFLLMIANNKPILKEGYDWLNLFAPTCVLRYLIDRTGDYYLNYPFHHQKIYDLKWFGLPIGLSGISLAALAVLNFVVLTYWIWQALKRSYRNPTSTKLSKAQSYGLTLCFTILNLGFTLQSFNTSNNGYSSLFIGNFLLGLGLITALSPQRQTLQDWARYRRENRNKYWVQLGNDLVWGEKSPAIVALFINFSIVATIWIFTMITVALPDHQLEMLYGVALHFSFLLMCASIAQLMFMMKTPKRTLWVTGILSALLFVPYIIIGMQWGYESSALTWSAFSFMGLTQAPFSEVLFPLIGEGLIIILSNLQLTRLLKKAGASESKALMGRSI